MPSDKLDMLLNPSKIRQQKEDTAMAKEDLRYGGQKVETLRF